jgi:hypothetical protein
MTMAAKAHPNSLKALAALDINFQTIYTIVATSPNY